MRGGIEAQKNVDRLYRDLNNARHLFGYTETDCARVLGISQGTYSKKYKERRFDALELSLLAEEFGCKLSILDMRS